MTIVTAWRSGVYHLLPCVIRTPKSEESYRRRNVWLLPYNLLKLPCIGLQRLLKFFKNPLITEAYRRTSSVNFLLLVIVSRFHRQLDVFLLALLCNSDVGRHKDTAFRSTYLLNALRTRSSMLRWNHDAVCISQRWGKSALRYFTSLFCSVGKGDFSAWDLMYRQRCCQGFTSCGMLRCVVERVVPDVSKDRSAFDLRVNRKKSAFVKALWTPEKSGTTPPATRRNITEVSILHISFSPLSSPQTWDHLKKPNLQSDAAMWLFTG